MRRWGWVLLLGFVGCANEAYRSLPERERDTFLRCSDVMPRCAYIQNGIERAGCIIPMQNEYASYPDEPARRGYLARNNCPPAVILSSGGSVR